MDFEFFEAQKTSHILPLKRPLQPCAMAAMWTLLSVFLCVSGVLGEDETCATCAQSPPAQSAALLQSSVQRHAKTAGEPHVFSPAQLFGPGPMGRRMHGPMGPRRGMGPHMASHPHMAHHFNFEQRRAAQGRAESLNQGKAGGEEIMPCQSLASWMPDKDIYGSCDTPVQPDAETCISADGCTYSWGYCYCQKSKGCAAVGGTWNLVNLYGFSIQCFSHFVMSRYVKMPFDLERVNPYKSYLIRAQIKMLTFQMLETYELKLKPLGILGLADKKWRCS